MHLAATLLLLAAAPVGPKTLADFMTLSDACRQGKSLEVLMGTMSDDEYALLEKAWAAKPADFFFVCDKTELRADQTAAIAAFGGQVLVLNAVTALDCAEIAKFKGRSLFLSGLTALSAPCAASLAKWRGQRLFLDGVEQLGPEAAEKLAAWKGALLSLRGLRRTDPETAEKLAKFKGGVAIKLSHAPAPPPPSKATREQLIEVVGAIHRGDVQGVRAFLAKGGDPNLDERGHTLLMETAAWRDVEIARALLDAGADVNAQTGAQQTPLSYALGEMGRDAEPATIRALVQLLVDHGAKLNPPKLKSPSEDAELMFKPPLMQAVARHDDELVRLLLKAGADPNGDDYKGFTPLMSAAFAADASAITLLLDAGADPRRADTVGNTALHELALNLNRKDAELVPAAKALIAKGASKAAKAHGKTAADFARSANLGALEKALR